ncbi:hypothetical protein A0J61_06721 [Choanephora cucurbitarum]|uniref:Uncharacterized protein n=1 Tax=Choanephora cucurbitarum TaxID=101091 RepID=A0A1C7NCY8_9FUNG|nr:hypothetical protein A0J61_06721 [Choanephora cucurbitarum]
MINQERSYIIRWHLGWLPHGCPSSYPLLSDHPFTRARAIHCLQIHNRLEMPLPVEDPLSFLLNILPTKKLRSPLESSPWIIRWPVICHTLHGMDYLAHSTTPTPNDPGPLLLQWLLPLSDNAHIV